MIVSLLFKALLTATLAIPLVLLIGGVCEENGYHTVATVSLVFIGAVAAIWFAIVLGFAAYSIWS